MSRLKTGALVYLEWWDHVGDGEPRWRFESEVGERKPSLVRSVGWVYREDREALTIVANHAEHHHEDSEPELSGLHTILKSCIKRRVKLKDPSRRRRN